MMGVGVTYILSKIVWLHWWTTIYDNSWENGTHFYQVPHEALDKHRKHLHKYRIYHRKLPIDTEKQNNVIKKINFKAKYQITF